MKKFLSTLVCALLVGAMLLVTFAGCADGGGSESGDNGNRGNRANILKVYTWEDYQYDNGDDDSLESDFNKYYRKLTGNPNFEVQFTTFSTPEEMLTKIETGKEDFDLACPSDYMIQQMIRKELVLPVDTSKLTGYSNLSPYIVGKHTEFEAAAKKASDTAVYSVPYMWGTMGSLYNTDKLTGAQVQSLSEDWSQFWDAENKDNVLIKDSMRDTFVIASMYANDDKLTALKDSGKGPGTEEYLAAVTDIINDASDENLKAVENALSDMKKTMGIEFEVDEGKAVMASGRKALNFAWSGDAVWAILEAKQQYEVNLAYVVPKIGSNLWFDGWVIPKYAANTDAAHAFMDFLLDPEIAILNMEYIGYTSGVATEEIVDWLQADDGYENTLADGYTEGDENIPGLGRSNVDLTYFFADSQFVGDASAISAPTYMFPSNADIEVCGIMRDFGDKTTAVANMWSRMKTSSLTTILIVVGVVVGLAVLAVALFFVIRKVRAPKKKQAKQTQAFRRNSD